MKYIIYFLFAILIFSCQDKNDSDKQEYLKKNKFEFNFTKKINFKLDNNTVNWSVNSQYFVDNNINEELILIFNAKTSTINVFNINGEIIKKIKFEREGERGVGVVQDFLYESNDCIYVLNDAFKVYRLSSEKKSVKIFNLMDSSSNNSSWPWSDDEAKMFLFDNKLYISANPGISYDKKRKEFFEKGLISIVLDVNTGMVKRQISYPNKEYLIRKDLTTSVVSTKCTFNYQKKQMIYHFASDPNLYVYNLDGRFHSKYLMKSRYIISEVAEISNKQVIGDSMAEALYFVNNAFYSRLYYDSYRKLYLRLVKQRSQEEISKKDLINGKIIKGKFSMIVADENFNVLGEVDLGFNEYGGYEGGGLFFITKDGILIQTTEANEEDTIFFNLYKLAKK